MAMMRILSDSLARECGSPKDAPHGGLFTSNDVSSLPMRHRNVEAYVDCDTGVASVEESMVFKGGERDSCVTFRFPLPPAPRSGIVMLSWVNTRSGPKSSPSPTHKRRTEKPRDRATPPRCCLRTLTPRRCTVWSSEIWVQVKSARCAYLICSS